MFSIYFSAARQDGPDLPRPPLVFPHAIPHGLLAGALAVCGYGKLHPSARRSGQIFKDIFLNGVIVLQIRRAEQSMRPPKMVVREHEILYSRNVVTLSSASVAHDAQLHRPHGRVGLNVYVPDKVVHGPPVGLETSRRAVSRYGFLSAFVEGDPEFHDEAVAL